MARFCTGANGFGDYRVAILGADGVPLGGDSAAPATLLSVECAAAGRGAGGPEAGERLARLPGSGPVTLLVIPD